MSIPLACISVFLDEQRSQIEAALESHVTWGDARCLSADRQGCPQHAPTQLTELDLPAVLGLSYSN